MNELIKVENWNGNKIRFVWHDGEWWAVGNDVAKALGLTTVEMLANEGEYVKETLPIKDDYNFILTTKGNLFLMRHFYGDYDYPVVPNYVETVESILLSKNEDYIKAFKEMVFDVLRINQSPFSLSETTSEIIKRLINLIGYPNEDKATNDEIKIDTKMQHQEKDIGFVYFLKADNGLVKIGKAKNLDRRLEHFTVKLPYALELVAFIKSERYHNIERDLHRKFKTKRVRGEWFSLTKHDIESLANEFKIKILV